MTEVNDKTMTEADLIAALEIARCALAADPLRTLGDHLDMTDEDMAGLRDKIEVVLGDCPQGSPEPIWKLISWNMQ